tara:strand:- start:318 stop:458 length:141 start_codon:yes stop_codon:yes gene_type:complete
MVIETAIIGIIFLIFCAYLLSQIERKIERKKLNNNLKNFKNGNGSR